MYRCFNVSFRQIHAQFVPVFAADNKGIPNRLDACGDFRQSQLCILETLQVANSELRATLVPSVEVVELDGQHRGLNFIEA